MAKSNITFDRFKALKGRIDAELLRRKYTQAVDTVKVPYDNEPTPKKPVETEHYQKINDPIELINENYSQSLNSQGKVIKNLDILDAITTTLESVSVTHSTGNCSGTCTGLCAGACSGDCTGSCVSRSFG